MSYLENGQKAIQLKPNAQGDYFYELFKAVTLS